MRKRQKKMMVLATIMVFMSKALFLPGLAGAGNLEPTAPPGPTMKTLDEIYDKLEVIDGKLGDAPGDASVEKTGQTTSYATGDDGELEKGVAWPNPRFTDNEDGTVTDNLTGLIWLENANCFGTRTWVEALSDCNGLASGLCSLTDGSIAGDWRLPNVKELQSLIHYGMNNPALSNTAETGQWTNGDPFTDVQWSGSGFYWSSTTDALYTGNAWYVLMGNGLVNPNVKTGGRYVWPVRGANYYLVI